MDGRGGGRKPFEVWEHVVKLNGNRVKCKHCELGFCASSATRVTSHLYSIPNQGIRGCPNFDVAARERDRNIERSGNQTAMAPDVYVVVLPNTAPENMNKRKEIPVVEVEHQRLVRGRFVDEFEGEEEKSTSPLHASSRKTSSIWHTIELHVANLEEKLDASVARERKLNEELYDLKVKSENYATTLEASVAHAKKLEEELVDLKAKSREEASQYENKILEIENKLKEAHKEYNWFDLTSCVSYDSAYIWDQIELVPGPTDLSLGQPDIDA